MTADSYEHYSKEASEFSRYDVQDRYAHEACGDGIDTFTESSGSIRHGPPLELKYGTPPAQAILRGDGLIDIHMDTKSRMMAGVISAVQKQGYNDEIYDPPPAFNEITTTNSPRLNILLQVVGSLGDVQPFLAIGKALQQIGHRVRLATHTMFRSTVESVGIEFFDIGGDPAELMAFMVKNPGLLPSYESTMNGELRDRRQSIKSMMERLWLSCFAVHETKTTINNGHLRRDQKPFVADAIIANPPSFAHVHCAQKLGIPLHMVFTMPWSPTRAFSHPLARVRSVNGQDKVSNYLSFVFVEMLVWQGLKTEINAFRTNTLHLEAISSIGGPLLFQRLKIPVTYCWSPSLIPRPKDWARHISVAGFCSPTVMPDFAPPSDLKKFLDAGPTPIYIGFGSIVVKDPEALTSLIFKAIEIVGVRAIVAQGWSGIGSHTAKQSSVYLLDGCPHDWLFQHVSCVVHHGGCGTTAAGLKAGKPTVAVPFFGDQFFWGETVERIGAGPPAIPYSTLTAESLAAAIRAALTPKCIETARGLSSKLRNENGAEGALASFHHALPLESMKCSLDPTRTASWRYRRKGSEHAISSFAATVLRKQGLIDSKHLRPFRPVRYQIDDGPFEPFGSSILSVTDLFYKTFKGFGEMAMEFENIATHVGADRTRDSTAAINYNSGPIRKVEPRLWIGQSFLSGTATVVGASLRAPGEFSFAIASGSRNMPRLWRDSTVRQQDEIKGFGSGCAIGVKELILETYDGIAGLVQQPYIGARDGGVLGAVSGVGKGIAGLPIKWLSAMAAPVAYPLKGMDVTVTNALRRKRRDLVSLARMELGEWEYAEANKEERQAVVDRWNELQLQ